jgi:LPXTG-motif cell wall-anchored protein
VQYGARNYSLLRPAKDAGDCDGVPGAVGASKTVASSDTGDASSNSTGLIIGGAVIAVLAAGGVLFFLRRRGTAAERE